MTLIKTSREQSSSHPAISMDIPDPFLPPLPIVHSFWQVFWVTSRIGTELLYVASSWSFCLCSSMWRGPQEYITYELVPTSPAVSCMSGSSNFDSFHDWWCNEFLNKYELESYVPSKKETSILSRNAVMIET